MRLFPLAGAVLFPRAHLPLHIFEPRYVTMVEEAMASDRCIAMIQPRGEGDEAQPPLYPVGCLGEIVEMEQVDRDGGPVRYDIVLRGIARFSVVDEVEVATPYRQATVLALPDPPGAALAPVRRSAVEDEARAFADWLGLGVDWEAVGSLDDETLIHAIAQVAPFDPAAKQALLEAVSLDDRADLAIQLMHFSRLSPGPVRDRTLQ